MASVTDYRPFYCLDMELFYHLSWKDLLFIIKTYDGYADSFT